MEDRSKVIIRTSFIGIAANVLLGAVKFTVGILANAFTVTLDAVNNLTDALSSVITVIGTKLAGKKPDKKHPLGHGRAEYIGTMVIAAIVLYAGITAAVESVKKIINPEPADYSTVSLVIIALAVVVKIALGIYCKAVGKKVNSGSLTASGEDASFDAVLSFSVLVSAIIYLTLRVNIEAYVGILISVFIIKSGIEMLLEAVDEVLGKRMDRETVEAVIKTVCEEPEVRGAYDLILHNYGPDSFVGSVHVEIPDTMSAKEIDQLERSIARRVYDKHGIILAGIGIYSFGDSDDSMRDTVYRIICRHDGVLQIHGYYADEENKVLSVDIILDFGLDSRESVYSDICTELKETFPEWRVNVTLDIDV